MKIFKKELNKNKKQSLGYYITIIIKYNLLLII